MADNLEQAALLLALRHSDRGWAAVTAAVEDAGSALEILDDLLAPNTPTLDHVDRDLDADLRRTADEIDSWLAEGIRVTTVLDQDYPVQLMLVHQHPPFLTYRGMVDAEDVTAVSVVGSRQASAAGLRRARAVASTLANNGFPVMSGLAAGIDTAAHRAAIDAGTRTVAVVGTGLRHCYPAENAELQNEIARTGAVLSQFWPDAGPAKHQFPMRNAVMSGCSIATVVVEAGEHSGARIQARIAVEHGRHVFLLPEVLVNKWAVDLANRPNTTVLEGPEHLLRVLGELTAEMVQV
ncbi:DNA-processing protein DprA [Kutzneria sp. NPDC052558]|uniref:DNA-processing protein DprA n=1 Tax=Kutzneria sp. NPDC052558 TaxID=3364121 RepID=UPI0037C57B02